MLLFVFLLLFLLCNIVVAATKLHIKKNKNKKINLHTFSVQLSITESFDCFCCSCCFCCYCVVLLLQQHNYTWRTTTTGTKRSIYIHFCPIINNSILLLLLFVLLQQQNYTWKTTRTKRSIYIHFLFNN